MNTLEMTLDPFGKGKAAELVNEYSKEDGLVDKVIDIFQTIDLMNYSYKNNKTKEGPEKIGITLNPSQLELLNAQLIDIVDGARFLRPYSQSCIEQLQWNFPGIFVTNLLKESYKAGYNDFLLTTNGKLNFYCANVHGTAKDPLKIKFLGDTGYNCCNLISNLDVRVRGSANSICFSRITDSNIHIEGNAERCGYGVSNTKFTVQGNCEKYMGDKSRDSEFEIFGNAGDDCARSSDNNIFKLHGGVGDNFAMNSNDSKFYINGRIGKLDLFFSENLEFYLNDASTYWKITAELGVVTRFFGKNKVRWDRNWK